MSNQLNRYNHPVVVEHLASRYSLGLLTPTVRRRLESLLASEQHRGLIEAISLQQRQLGQLDAMVMPAIPDQQVWQDLQQSIGMDSTQPNINEVEKADVVTLPTKAEASWFKRMLPMAASIMLLAIVWVFYQPAQQSQLSYIAVMTNADDQAALVAATYGDSKALTLDFVDLPPVEDDLSYELWVTSKTDRQIRSLGVIDPTNEAFTRTLSEAEWRLIKDSATLIVTIEEYGGSAIGEPMGEQIAEGLCVRLSAWEA